LLDDNVSQSWGRAFLCGDAAHVHSPAGGQGMNTGMQDAFNLAWKLAAVANGHGGEKLLNSYSAERSEVGERVLADAQRLTVVGTMKNPVQQAIRNTVGHLMLGLAPIQQAFADKMTEVTLGYSKSPLNGSALRGGPKPGARVVPIAGQIPVGSGKSPRFGLFAKSSAAVTGLIERFSTVLDPEHRFGAGLGRYGDTGPALAGRRRIYYYFFVGWLDSCCGDLLRRESLQKRPDEAASAAQGDFAGLVDIGAGRRSVHGVPGHGQSGGRA
jgi:hypothetical protein